jgi:dolichol-phosphate mannosyltransferase
MEHRSLDRDFRSDARPILSIVVPAYNEEGNLDALVAELDIALRSEPDWELLFVDDGSRDATWESIAKICERDRRIKGIRLSRNFGHQYALLAGLTYARGDAAVMMDADLQHPPEVVPLLLQKWREGSKIVHTIRLDSGKETLLKRLTSKAFYGVFTFLSGSEIRPGMADFRLVDRIVLDTLLEFKEEGLFLRGLVNWVGFDSSTVEFECGERLHGTSSYTLKKMLQLAIDGIASFSLIPLRLAVLTGLLTSVAAFMELGYVLYVSVIKGDSVPGWASVVSLTTLLFGILFILLGIVGEYIGRILVEVRGRPRFIASDLAGITRGSAASRIESGADREWSVSESRGEATAERSTRR